MPYGSLHVEDPREFDRTLNDSEGVDEAMDALRVRADLPLSTPPVQDWPQIVDCVRRGEGYSIDAQHTNAFRARISFDTARAELGDYEIRLLGRQPEAGRVLKITRVEDVDRSMHEYRALDPFPERFVVVTSGPMGSRRIWLIGITSVRETPVIDANA